MNTRIFKFFVIVGLLVVLLGGCTFRKGVAITSGLIIGATACKDIGLKGNEQIIAMATCAIIVAILANQIDENARTAQVLDRTPTGETVSWENPDKKKKYEVTPTQTYDEGSKALCREFTFVAIDTVEGKKETLKGNACRRSDGLWELKQLKEI